MKLQTRASVIAVWFAACLLPPAFGDTGGPPAFKWDKFQVLINADGNFGIVTSPTKPFRIPANPAVAFTYPPKRYSWDLIEKNPLKSLPRFTQDNVSALIGMPGCRILSDSERVLVSIPDTQEILSPVRSRLAADDVSLDNQLNFSREDAAWIRYTPAGQKDTRPRDLVLVRYDLVSLFDALLVDHPSWLSGSIIGYILAEAGLVIVFDTRLSGFPKNELEMLGAGLENAMFENPIRLHWEPVETGIQVVVETAPDSEWGDGKEELETLQAWRELADDMVSWIADAKERQTLKERYLKDYAKAPTVLSKLLGVRLAKLEVQDTSGAVICKAGVDEDCRTRLLVPRHYLPDKGVAVFNLVIHHQWGRDIVRPVAIKGGN